MARRAAGSMSMAYIGQCSPISKTPPGWLIPRSFYGYMTDMVTFSSPPGQSAYSAYFASQVSPLTGTPLFTQLSSSAAASSVGAFSLRAVNGTSARAVNVRNGTTSATQDFYADRLGNLLTAPVTGQSLASWLGGATGYVTTWYDQSGRGNHATQGTAANQPIIARATKGPGYACYFVGNPNQMSFNTPTGNIFDNTDYSILVVNRRTIPFTPYQYFFGTFPPSAGSPRIGFGYTADNQVRFRKENLAVGEFINCIVPGYAGISEPTGYDYGVFSQTSGMNSYSWRSGNQTTATNATYTTPLTLSGPAIIGAQRNNQYFTGEIYEVLVFTKSLYDLDGTSTINQIYQNQLGIYGT